MAGRTQQIGFGTWYSSSQQSGTREAAGRTQIIVAQDEMFNAAAAGDTVTTIASLTASGIATGTAAVAGGTIATAASLVDGAAVGLGPLTARQYIIGGLLPLFVEESNAGREFVIGATFVGETLVAVAIGVDAEASGGILTTTASLLAGAASAGVSATAPGATLSANASLISGAASSTAPATAPGATIEARARLIGGGTPEVFRQYAFGGLLPLFITETGTRDAIVSATFLEETSGPAVIAGASGSAAPTPALLTVAATLVPGLASVITGATANGATITVAASVVAGSASGVANVAGQSLPATAAILAGTASGTAIGVAAGVVLTAPVSTLAGAAAGAANKAGDTLTITTALIPGAATAGTAGDAFAEGALLEASASLVPGAATGESVIAIISGGGQGMRFEPQDAVAHGALIIARARLIAGHASTLSLFAGTAVADAEAANDNLPPVLVSLVAGEAQGQRSYSDDELLMIFAEAA